MRGNWFACLWLEIIKGPIKRVRGTKVGELWAQKSQIRDVSHVDKESETMTAFTWTRAHHIQVIMFTCRKRNLLIYIPVCTSRLLHFYSLIWNRGDLEIWENRVFITKRPFSLSLGSLVLPAVFFFLVLSEIGIWCLQTQKQDRDWKIELKGEMRKRRNTTFVFFSHVSIALWMGMMQYFMHLYLNCSSLL